MNLIQKIKSANKLLNAGPILRRYFAMNGFDGCLTALGVILGTFIAQVADPLIIILTTISTAFALLISGFSSAYFVEKAERIRAIKHLEKKLLHSIEHSDRTQAANIVSLEAALVDGLSPFSMTLLIVSPFFTLLFGLIEMTMAFYISILIALTLVFILGFYLGKISEQNAFMLGIKMLLAGIFALIISMSLSLVY